MYVSCGMYCQLEMHHVWYAHLNRIDIVCDVCTVCMYSMYMIMYVYSMTTCPK